MPVNHNPNNLKEGQTVIYKDILVEILYFIDPITVRIQGLLGRDSGNEVYYRSKWNKLWNIKSYRYREYQIVTNISVSIWNLKPAFTQMPSEAF